MTQFGFDAFFQDQMTRFPGLAPARVTAVLRESFHLVTPWGERQGKLKTSVFFRGESPLPTVGDWAAVSEADGDTVLIHSVLERKSHFSRQEPGHKMPTEQSVAANFDMVGICMSLNRDFNIARVERYLTLAWQSGATPVVVLTKADLCPDPSALVLAAEAAAPGVEVCAVSALTGAGMEIFGRWLKPGATLVLLGTSGTGKSSLINALLGREQLRVGDIREDDARGRHTTTHRELVTLPDGAMLIDTPGMRSVGLLDSADGLSELFADIEALVCRFSDCTHSGEPGCAVRAAVDEGLLDPVRLDRYEKLRKELKYLDRKENLKERLAARQAEKRLCRQIREFYKEK